MDQDTAQVLFQEGAMLIFLDMPQGSEFGMDFNSWNVGPEFRGMKMIPPGVHFVYYSAVDRDMTAGLRSGFFHNFQKREVLVKKWDCQLEDIKTEAISSEEQASFEERKQNMDRFLAPYPYEGYKKWVSLTKYIIPQTVLDLQPETGVIRSVAEFVSEPSTSQSRKQDAEAEAMAASEDGNLQPSENRNPSRHKTLEDKLPNLKIVQGSRIQYTQIPKQKYPEGASPGEITKYSIDASFQLQTMIKERYEENLFGVLGEIQFAFICFLMGQNYDSFEQWKRLVHILCTSDEALHTYPKLFLDFIGVLHFQVREIPEDFFVDIVSHDNFLTTTLHELFSNLESRDVDVTLRSRGLKFRQHLTDKFKWDFTSEPDEYAPVVVESAE